MDARAASPLKKKKYFLTSPSRAAMWREVGAGHGTCTVTAGVIVTEITPP